MRCNPKATGCLYVIDFPNGKAYYGITSRGLPTRLSEHLATARKGAPYSISRALRLYDYQFIAEVLLVASMEYLVELEPRVIQLYCSRGHGGYNQALGGHLGSEFTLEERWERSQLRLGGKHTDEAKAKMRAAWITRQRGYKWSEAEREKRALQPHPRAMLGRKHTPEAIEKIRQASLRRVRK